MKKNGVDNLRYSINLLPLDGNGIRLKHMNEISYLQWINTYEVFVISENGNFRISIFENRIVRQRVNPLLFTAVPSTVNRQSILISSLPSHRFNTPDGLLVSNTVFAAKPERFSISCEMVETTRQHRTCLEQEELSITLTRR